jgi:hypothetical protein
MLRAFSIGLFCIVLGAAAPAFGGSIVTHPSTAPGAVTLVTASDGLLAERGLPPRPDALADPDRYATWLRVVRSIRAPLDVGFLAVPAPAAVATSTPAMTPDWAGAILTAPDAVAMEVPAHRFAGIEGEWIVPKARPTITCSNPSEQTDGSSLWIAIDGWMSDYIAHEKQKDGSYRTYRSADILQAGSESDVPCRRDASDASGPTSSYFWIEWSGTRNIAVTPGHTNLTVRAGDVIYVRIAAVTTGADAWKKATVWFANETTGYYIPARTFDAGCIDCGTPYQRSATLFGDTAEWMTEATFYSAQSPALPNTLDDFGNVTMTSAFAKDQTGVTYEPGRSGTASVAIDWMTWNGVGLARGGTLLACTEIADPRTLTFSRAPYVIVSPGDQGNEGPVPSPCR